MTEAVFFLPQTEGIEYVQADELDKAWLARCYEDERALMFGDDLLPPPEQRYISLMAQIRRAGRSA